MTKKKKLFSGFLDAIPKKEIILNIGAMEKGNYMLK